MTEETIAWLPRVRRSTMPRGTTLQQGLEDLVAEVIDLGKEVNDSVETMARAMETRDADLARGELGVDTRYKARGAEAQKDCMVLQASRAPPSNTSDGRGGAPEWRMRAALIVHYLERISDHGVDIGERTKFLLAGERIEEAMQQYLERNADYFGDGL